MDQDTLAVKAFLVSMEPVRETLHDLQRDLWKRSEVKRVALYFPALRPSTDFGASADLHNGAIVDFWVSLSDENGSWQIEYSVYRRDPNEDGSHVEMERPTQSVLLAMDLSPALLSVLGELRNATANDVFFR